MQIKTVGLLTMMGSEPEHHGRGNRTHLSVALDDINLGHDATICTETQEYDPFG